MVKSLEFVPPRATEEICNVAAPELVTVTVCGPLVVPSVMVGKETLEGVRVTAGFFVRGAEAVPPSWTGWGGCWASSGSGITCWGSAAGRGAEGTRNAHCGC